MPTKVTNDPDPETVPAPSALRRLAEDPHDRKKFLRMAGVGAAGALSVALAACGSSSTKSTTTMAAASTTAATKPASTGSAKQDLEILNYALTLEYLEAAFYKDVIGAGLFSGATLDEIKQFGQTEQDHVDALTATIKKLGGTPVTAPKTKFPLDSASSVLKLAATVENLGAAAYLAQAPRIMNLDVLAAALSIHSVEARHAAALNAALDVSVTPDGAFGKPADMATVLAAVKPFIVS